MRRKDQRTLDAIFAKRVDGNIEWKAVEALLRALGLDTPEVWLDHRRRFEGRA